MLITAEDRHGNVLFVIPHRLLQTAGLLSFAAVTLYVAGCLFSWQQETVVGSGTAEVVVTERWSRATAWLFGYPPDWRSQHVQNQTVMFGPLKSGLRHGVWTVLRNGEAQEFLVHYDVPEPNSPACLRTIPQHAQYHDTTNRHAMYASSAETN